MYPRGLKKHSPLNLYMTFRYIFYTSPPSHPSSPSPSPPSLLLGIFGVSMTTEVKLQQKRGNVCVPMFVCAFVNADQVRSKVFGTAGAS